MNTKISKIKKDFTNLVIINNHKENNFIDYNQFFQSSKGDYVIFLSYNTKVYANWLDFLINLIENDKKIGMVGSKIIYSNGLLEEAGSIAWNNGEFSNFAELKAQNLPEFNYVKEVDYVSGSSLIIRKSAWKLLRGFDDRYESLFYKLIDFSFKLRKYGFKVMYQPKSVVKHYFKYDKNNNILLNIKNNKTLDKNLILKKWKNELEHKDVGKNKFFQIDNGFNKKRIFVIDLSIPNFENNAGARCTFMYLKLFKEIGLQVTFLADNLKMTEPYTTILQQEGIEILYGKYYKNHFNDWIKDNLKYFDYVYLQRPEVALKYLDIIKENFSGKIFYFAHDLHYIRLLREYEITKNIIKKRESEKSKTIEMDIFSKVDIIHVVGNNEQKILKKKFIGKPIRNIPLYIYSNQVLYIEKDFSKRKGLIFVASFSHSPNEDAILWFIKGILPRIIKKFPDIILHIVGSPITEKISKLKTPNIEIEGSLSDYELHSLYEKCRIAVAPLRFGSGVKGKIVEAAYYQIPMITTSIGAEGLDRNIKSFLVEDNPDKMAKLINQLYNDFSKLKQMSDSGKIFIRKYFSFRAAKKELLRDINIIKQNQ